MVNFLSFVGTHPFFCLTLLALPAVYLPPPASLAYGALLTGVSVLASWNERRAGWTVTGILWTAVAVVMIFQLSVFLRTAPAPTTVGSLRGWGVVSVESPVNRQGQAPFSLRIKQSNLPEWKDREIRVSGWTGPSPALGSLWQWEGKISRFQALDRTLVSLKLSWCRPQGWEAPWWEARAHLRQRLFDAWETLDDGPAALSQALVLGATDDLTPYEKESFRVAGCSHVLALSGMHLSLWAVLLGGIFHRRAPRVVAFLVIQAVLGFYCFLAGPIPSLLRAWVMSFLAGIYGLRFISKPPLEILGLSFLVCVVVWPDMAPTLSLQLSFLSLVGLFLWSKPWEMALRPKLGSRGAALLAPSAAALVPTAPLVGVLFHEIRWAGLFLSPPLVFLTDLYIYLSLGYCTLAVAFPWVPWEVFNPVFGAFYRAIFFCTDLGKFFPSLALVPFLVLAGAGGLCYGAFLLYNNRHRRLSMSVGLNYDSPADLQRFLDSRGYNALKRWGQNFLINPGARLKILDALELKAGEAVWEIGPGLGALTHHLVEKGHPLTVFEIDPGYAGFLREEFGTSAPGFRLVEGDVLKTWRNEFSGQPLDGGPALKPAPKAVGNLPYNAASAIIADFIDGGYFPDIFVVTVQKEMAERMAAQVGTKNYSSFSVLCQSVFQVKEVMVLRPGSFYPAPEVTSWVVKLIPHRRFPGIRYGAFSTLVRESFSSRRKTLRNNIPGAASALKKSDAQVTQAFTQAGIDLGRRAETLTVQEFVNVYNNLQKEGN